MARIITELVDDGNPLCVPVERPNWATSITDVIQVKAEYSGKPLCAIFISNKSESDRFLVNRGTPGVGSEVYLGGVKRPFFAFDRSVDRDYFITPWQVYNTSGLDNTGGTLTEAAFTVDSSWSATYRGALQYWRIADLGTQPSGNPSSMGAYLALEAWYGDYPRLLSSKRDDWDISGILTVNTATNTWRNIVAGRQDWSLTSIDSSGISTLAWEIFGVIESWKNSSATRRRISLASGTGAFAQAGVNHYDAIEVDFSDSAAGSGYQLLTRFTARD